MVASATSAGRESVGAGGPGSAAAARATATQCLQKTPVRPKGQSQLQAHAVKVLALDNTVDDAVRFDADSNYTATSKVVLSASEGCSVRE